MNYLLDVTFYAGSNAEDDTDNELFLMSTNDIYLKEQLVEIFNEVNSMLNISNEDLEYDKTLHRTIPLSYYDNGINIHTLMRGIEEYLNVSCTEIHDNNGPIDDISNYYQIIQWQ